MRHGVAYLALLGLLVLVSCTTAQIQNSQATAQTAASYIKQAEAGLSAFQDTYGNALALFVDDQAKAAEIVAKVDPILAKAQASLAKAQASLAAAKALAESYAAAPIPATWAEFKTNWQACGVALVNAGLELAKLVKELQEQ